MGCSQVRQSRSSAGRTTRDGSSTGWASGSGAGGAALVVRVLLTHSCTRRRSRFSSRATAEIGPRCPLSRAAATRWTVASMKP